jgi:hypothetical protein
VQGRVAFKRRNAAHDQITERRYSVARFRISITDGRFAINEWTYIKRRSASELSEIRYCVTSNSRNLIAAFRNILSKLERKSPAGRDEEAFAELKRIMNHRIDDLENSPPTNPAQHPVVTSRDAD